MEKEILSDLTNINFIDVEDLRTKLAINSNGRKWKIRESKNIKGMVWHQELGWGSIESVAKYHTGTNSHLYKGGVESISYTWSIRRNGNIVLCNDLNKSTWSQGYAERTGDENAEFMSVMFEGLFTGIHVTDYSAGNPTDSQMLSGLILWKVCKKIWNWNENDLYGHYEFGKPACPGKTLIKIIKSVKFNYEEENVLSDTEGRQQALIDLGYLTGTVDGMWGPKSKGALINFQINQNLIPDGVLGFKTERAIIKALERI